MKVGGGPGVDAAGREVAEKHKGAGGGVAKIFFGKPIAWRCFAADALGARPKPNRCL